MKPTTLKAGLSAETKDAAGEGLLEKGATLEVFLRNQERIKAHLDAIGPSVEAGEPEPVAEDVPRSPAELVRDFLFEHGMREAEKEQGTSRDEASFRFLARYVLTFPEMEDDLLQMDVFKALKTRRAMEGWNFTMPHIWEAVRQQPLASKATIRFLRRYLPEGSPFRTSSISAMARELRWFEAVKDGKPRPDQRRVRNILHRYADSLQAWGIEHTVRDRPGPKGGG